MGLERRAPLRFLLSGPGLIGSQHARLIGAADGAILQAVVAPHLDASAPQVAEQTNAQWFATVDEALDASPIDAAIISSPNEFHTEQALACIGRGIPVLVEKPLADDVRRASEIAKASQQSGVPVLVGHHRTYSPLLALARDFMQSDSFGRVVCAQGSALFYKPDDYFAAGPWRTRKGGGPILINLIHEIGIMRYLVGEIASVAVTASNAMRRFEVEDTVGIVLTFENGAVGTFLLSDRAASSKSWEMTSGENPAYPCFPDENCYHFAGEVGSLDFPSMQARSYLGTPKRSWWERFEEIRIATKRFDPLERQLQHFTDVVRGRAAPVVSAAEGLANMIVLAAVERAAHERRTVDVAEVKAEYSTV